MVQAGRAGKGVTALAKSRKSEPLERRNLQEYLIVDEKADKSIIRYYPTATPMETGKYATFRHV